MYSMYSTILNCFQALFGCEAAELQVTGHPGDGGGTAGCRSCQGEMFNGVEKSLKILNRY